MNMNMNMNMNITNYDIKEEPNEIDDHILDLFESSFKFDHVKGLGEWIKNSVDAYIREGIADEEQDIVLRFTNGEGHGSNALIECIDFVGMPETSIVNALKRWGDPKAAKMGKNYTVYGGHGNGGKFYMRGMFDQSYFITFRNGRLNIFGFSKNKRYGFAKDFRDLRCSPEEALKIANLNNLDLSSRIKERVLSGKTGFTVVKGISPKQMKNLIRVNMICNRLKTHSQVRRLLQRVPITIVYNDEIVFEPLKPEPLDPLPGFDFIEPTIVPETLELKNSDGSISNIEISNKKYPQGVLKLFTSAVAMEPSNRFGELNRIDIIGELGVIASYEIHELPSAGFLPQLVFIYGECECPSLESPELGIVQNDRSKLVENDVTKSLLNWIGQQVQSLAEQISEKERQEQEKNQRDISSLYNNFLDNWKNKFMSRVFSKILNGPGEGPGGGNGFVDGFGPIGSGTDKKGKSGSGENRNSGGGESEKKGRQFPRILLSRHDIDPLSDSGETLVLDPRHGVVYQRPQDVKEGIYWINTSSPLADAILEKYGANDLRWRDYLLQRYIDIFIQEALDKLERRDPEDFTSSSVSRMIQEVTMGAQEAASQDLKSFLFEENFDPNGAKDYDHSTQ